MGIFPGSHKKCIYREIKRGECITEIINRNYGDIVSKNIDVKK